jgi:hypothetical protein
MAVMTMRFGPVPWLGFMVTPKLSLAESASRSKFLMLKESIRRTCCARREIGKLGCAGAVRSRK